MSAEQNKAVTLRFVDEFWAKGNLNIADELLADNYVNHKPPPGVASNREGYKQWGSIFHSAFEDVSSTGHDVIAEGDKVAVRWTFNGTHKGEFMGVPATDKQVALNGITVVRLVDGKCVEDWTEMDAMGLMQQLGAVPPPG